ncbi:hypothetical protein BST61_g10235 [Cercospora zeina]
MRRTTRTSSRRLPEGRFGKSERMWKGAKTVLSRKGRSAELLLKEISEYLTLLAERQIIDNTALLGETKFLVEELCPQSTTTNMHNIHGDNVGTLYGGTNVNSGSGHQFNGAGGTYNFGGVQHEGAHPSPCPYSHRPKILHFLLLDPDTT